MEPMPFSRFSIFCFSISCAFFFITSRVSLILDCRMILCSFSSWLSISMYCRICDMVTFSLWPCEMASSKANSRSNARAEMPSSSSCGQDSGTILESICSTSRSSRMLLDLFVTSTRYMASSSGWNTYRTLSVSTYVCCRPSLPTSFGKADSRPSILLRFISTYCRASRGFPPLVTIAALRTTIAPAAPLLAGGKGRRAEPGRAAPSRAATGGVP